jgi:hypothetical protein
MASFRARGGRVRGDLDDLGGAGAGGQTPGGRRLASSNTSATTPTWLRGRIMRLTGSPGKYSDPAYTDLSFRVPSSLDYRLNQPRRRRRSHAASPGTRYTGPPPNRRRHGEQLPARGPRPGGARNGRNTPAYAQFGDVPASPTTGAASPSGASGRTFSPRLVRYLARDLATTRSGSRMSIST